MTHLSSLRRHSTSDRRRTIARAARTLRFRKLLHESLENRALLAADPYLAVFAGLTAADDLDEQADHARSLLTSSGTYLDVTVLEALDFSGTFLIQGDSDDTAESLTASLQGVPGFQFVQTFNPGFAPEAATPTRSNPKAALAESLYGPFDYDTYLSREKNGEFPDQGGLVDAAEADVLVNNGAGNTGTSQFTQSEISLVAFDNTVVIGFNDAGSIAGGSNKFTGFARSTDGGTTFVDGGTLPTNSEGDAGDPVLARHDATGRLYFSTLQFSGSGIRMFRSDDNGVTWQAPVQATPGVPAGTFQDKQWHAVDNFAGPGNGNVYLMSREFGGRNGIFFFRSTDGGNTFGPTGGTFIASGSQGSFVAVGSDHSVYAFWWAGSQIMMRKSVDQGLTFGAPIAVATGLLGGTNGDLGLVGQNNGEAFTRSIRSNSFPHAVVNPVNGHIYVTYNTDPVGADKGDVFMVMSSNGGATWSPPVKVNDDLTLNDQWQPTLAVTPDGSKLGIFYYSRQEDTTTLDGDPVNNQFKYYGRIGNIVGSTVTFAPSFAISDVPSQPEVGRDSVVNTLYMGDYDQAVATPGAFHVTWADNRSPLPGGGTRMDPNVQYERISLGLAVTTTVPAVNSVVSVAPTVFTVNVSEPLNAATVDAGDLEVNGVAADFVAYIPGSTTLTFTFASSPVTVQGLQSMHVDAGAFASAGAGGDVAPFDGQFRFDAVALQVTSTSPPFPGGIFTLPGPFTYDVTFNEPVLPGSVQTTDLALSGIGGAFVSGVTVLPGNTTARFTISGITGEGALGASIAAGAVTDVFGNPSSAFSATYQVDFGTVPYPVPLASKNPLGSLIYDPTVSGVINFVGDLDNFTINLDPNQTISILVTPTSPGLQPRVELFNPANVSLGFAQAAAAGQITGIQTREVATGGVYRIAVNGAGGSVGNYTVQITLNAALELEGKLPGVNNDSLATAQDIDGSFVTLAGTADRGAVLGTTDPPAGYSATSVAFGFTDISATGTTVLSNVDDSFASVAIGFNFNFFGTNFSSLFVSSNGLITFGAGNSSFSNSTLSANPIEAAIAPFWDDLYLFNATGNAAIKTQLLGPVGSRQLVLQWDKVNFFASTGGDTLTFQVILFEGSNQIRLNYLDLATAGDSRSEGTGATAGIKRANPTGGSTGFVELINNSGPNAFVGSGRSTVISLGTGTSDLYKFTLAAGETTTVAATALAAGTLSVELLNSVGTVLATGVSGATNLTTVISNFAVGAAGTYYARVSGSSSVPYSLVATRNAALDTEPNDTLAGAQNIDGLQGVLGHVSGGGGASTLTINALDSGWYDQTGLHGPTNTNYVVGLGGIERRNFFAFNLAGITQTITGATLVALNPSGGYSSPDATETYTLFDISTPVPTLLAGGSGQLATFNDLGSGVVFGSQVVSAANNNTLVSIPVNGAGVAALEAARGGLAALGGSITTLSGSANQFLFAFTSSGTRQLVLNLGQPEDWYSVNVTTLGDILSFRTSTPADGPGEFVNVLNPKIELYGPSGALVASGVALADGRNEVVTHTPLTTGTYRLRVLGEGGTAGEYFVSRNNVPSVTIDVTSPINEGDAAVLTGQIVDELTDSHTVVIDWGPGETSTVLNLPPGVLNFSVPHVYADDNPTGTSSDVNPISVTVTDNFGAVGEATGGTVLSPPAELIVNGGFETGTFANWTVSLIGPNGWQINNGTLDPASPATPLPPISGSFDAMTDPFGPSTRSLTQSFVVPADVHQATLSWLDRIQNFAAEFVNPTQQFRVQILNSADAVLATVFSTTPGDPLIQVGPNNRTVNITALLQAHEGEVLKIRFEEQDSLFYFNATIDNVSLQVVTATEAPPPEVIVNNVAPVLDPFLLDNCIDDNGVVTISGSFVDPGLLDTHQVVISWGDGSPDTVIDLTVGERSFSASHPYAPGTTPFAAVHTVGVSITDDDGGSDGASGKIAVAAGQGAYTLRRSADGLNLQLLRGSTLLIDQPFDSIHLVAVVGAANKSDSLNVNGINGNPMPVFGVGFAGRLGNQDTLTISNAAYDLMAYEYENGDDGHITLQQGSLIRSICFDDLEQITTTATTAIAQFQLPDTDNDAVLQRSSSSLTLTPATGIWEREPFVPTRFINPTLNLAIAGRGGDDIVEIIGGSSITLPLATVMDVEMTEIEMGSSATLTTPVMDVRGDFQLNGVGRLNGSRVQVYGDVTSKNGFVPGTAVISLVGDGDQTLSGAGVWGQLPHLDISKTGGTVTVLTDIGVRGNLTGSGGTFAPSAAAIVLQEWDSNINFSGPVSLYNLEIYKIYTEEARLQSDLVVQGDLRVLSGGLDIGGNTVTVGGNLHVAAYSWLAFAVDVAAPPAAPLLDVAGTLSFAANSKLKVTTAGSSGPSVGGNHELVEAGDILGFDDVVLDFPGAVDAIFEDLDSLYLDLVEP